MANVSIYPDDHRQPCTIPSGSNLSNAISTCRARGMDIKKPATWTAADIGFDVSEDGSVWYPRVKSDGTRVKCTGVSVSANQAISCPAEMWGGGAWPLMRLVSLDTANESAENQTQAVDLEVKFYV